jgi:hypothetical protein
MCSQLYFLIENYLAHSGHDKKIGLNALVNADNRALISHITPSCMSNMPN